MTFNYIYIPHWIHKDVVGVDGEYTKCRTVTPGSGVYILIPVRLKQKKHFDYGQERIRIMAKSSLKR